MHEISPGSKDNKVCINKSNNNSDNNISSKKCLASSAPLPPFYSFILIFTHPTEGKPTSFVLIYLSSTASAVTLILKTCISSKAIGILGAWFEHNVNVVFAYARFHTWKTLKWMQGLHLAELSCRRMQNIIQTSTSYHIHLVDGKPYSHNFTALPPISYQPPSSLSQELTNCKPCDAPFHKRTSRVFVFQDGYQFIIVFVYFSTI